MGNSEFKVSDDRYRLLVESITDHAIYMLDPAGVIASWNPGARRLKGYSEAETLGQHFSRFYTDEDRATGLPARALKTAATEGRFESEGWCVRKDCSRFWASIVIEPIRSASGKLLGYSKVTRDLTGRRIKDEALRVSEERFRLLVQSVTDYAIYMLDPDGRVTNWNIGAQRIKGYRPEEIIGEHFSRFYTEEDKAAGLPALGLKTAAREGRFIKEGWRLRKDGSRFLANVVIDPIRNESGKLIGYAKVTRDVTERRDSQRALEAAREALQQSQKMEAVGQLTGGIAHDFNNLLMAILGSLELIKKRLPRNSNVDTLLDNVKQAAQRGATLTQRMLAFARRQELTPVAVDIPQLVRGMSDLLQRSLGPSIVLETHFPSAVGQVHADANQLEMSLLNLAVNARDAMPQGGSIVIAAEDMNVSADGHTRLPAGRYVCLSVTDTGEGMDDETLVRSVEPFFTTKGIGKGTGLGLSMVHGFAEQMGGCLLLTSRMGEGTRVELCLPVAESAQETSLVPHLKSETDTEIRPLVVIAVDDDNLVLMNTASMLEDLGHKVFEASSGREALDILRREKAIDLVISDQAMPHMTGLQLAEAIKNEWPTLPIILATGYSELPPGADLPKLAKPFLQHDLAKAIAGVV
jgi:PAS domain S-box-containing protein